MAGEWEETTLADVSSDVSYGYTESATDEKVGPHFLRITDIQNGVVNWANVPYCPISAENHQKYRLQKGDIVVARTGNSTGENYLYQGDEDAVFASYLIRFRIDRKKADPKFIRYNLRSRDWWNFINNSKTGSAQAGANAQILGRFSLNLPRIEEQRAIAHILGTLDDKIELNRRMNETLEAMARALFKSWFVDFDPVRAKAASGPSLARGPRLDPIAEAERRDPGLPKPLADLFPDSFEDSELGEIPKGWKVEQIGDHMLNFDSKRVPVSGRERAKRQGPYPYHGAAGIMDFVDDYLFDGIFLLVGEDGSVIKDDGMAVTQYVWGKIWVNNHAHVLRGKGAVSTEQLYLYFHFEQVAPYVTGAVQPKLSQGRMNSMPFLFAGDAICGAFEKMVAPLFSRLRANIDSLRTLTALRDTLLPKLISGEVRVNDAERFVDSAA